MSEIGIQRPYKQTFYIEHFERGLPPPIETCPNLTLINSFSLRLTPLFLDDILGWAEKWKNDILKCADVDYYGTMYIKQGSIDKNRIFKILAWCFCILKFGRTLYK